MPFLAFTGVTVTGTAYAENVSRRTEINGRRNERMTKNVFKDAGEATGKSWSVLET
jgi:hypothetical protein